MEKMCKLKGVYKETANIFSKEMWEQLVVTSNKITEAQSPTPLGILNQSICHNLSFTGKYEMPVVKAIHCNIPKEIIAFYQMKRYKGNNYIPHFYTDDRKFENVWSFPRKALQTFMQCQEIISTDFSVYEDLLFPQKLWNIFRNKLLAAWWQYCGLKVIPNISWIHGKDYDISFDGWPKKSLIAVNSTGVGNSDRCKAMWLEGYNIMLETLKPTHILRYGVKIEGECEQISTYYRNDNKKFGNYGW